LFLFNKILLMLHFLGLAMGFAVPFANIVMMSLIKKATPPEQAILGRFPLAMSMVGKIGLVVLWITGVTMVFTRWHGFGTLPPAFHVKLTAVVLLTVCIGYISHLEKRIKRGDAAALVRIQAVGKAAMGFALVAVIFAVLTFN
jgi:hypothetical protein